MNPKKKRRSSVVEVGKGTARVRIYKIQRKDGYPQFTQNWKEGGRRRTRCLACLDEARMIAPQTSVRLTNAWHATDEATKRDIELLRHCEGLGIRPKIVTQNLTHVNIRACRFQLPTN